MVEMLDFVAEKSALTHPGSDNFPIVCVGGSAGGLEAYARLLMSLPSDLNAALVVVNHVTLVPTRLHAVLEQYTQMPVELIEDGVKLRQGRVFVIPSNRELHVDEAGRFRLAPISKDHGWPDVITVFLHSVAKNWSGQIVAVIVSGTGSDGAEALRAVKGAGGFTSAQEPSTAVFPDMPQNAIASGCVDFVLAPEDIAQKIGRICSRTL